MRPTRLPQLIVCFYVSSQVGWATRIQASRLPSGPTSPDDSQGREAKQRKLNYSTKVFEGVPIIVKDGEYSEGDGVRGKPEWPVTLPPRLLKDGFAIQPTKSAANVVKTEYSTFTYFITSLSSGQTVTATDIVVSSKVVTAPPSIEATPVLQDWGKDQISSTPIVGPTSGFHLMATKTYFTTSTFYTTYIDQQRTVTKTRSSVRSSVVTESYSGGQFDYLPGPVEQTLAPSIQEGPQGPKYLSLGPNIYGLVKTFYATYTYANGLSGESKEVITQVSTSLFSTSILPSSISVSRPQEAIASTSALQLNADTLLSLKQSFIASDLQPSLTATYTQGAPGGPAIQQTSSPSWGTEDNTYLSSLKESFQSALSPTLAPTAINQPDSAPTVIRPTPSSSSAQSSAVTPKPTTPRPTRPGKPTRPVTIPPTSLKPPTSTQSEAAPDQVTQDSAEATDPSGGDTDSAATSDNGQSGGLLGAVVGGLSSALSPQDPPAGLQVDLGPVLDAVATLLRGPIRSAIANRRNTAQAKASERAEEASNQISPTKTINPPQFARIPSSDPNLIPVGVRYTTSPTRDSNYGFIPLNTEQKQYQGQAVPRIDTQSEIESDINDIRSSQPNYDIPADILNILETSNYEAGQPISIDKDKIVINNHIIRTNDPHIIDVLNKYEHSYLYNRPIDEELKIRIAQGAPMPKERRVQVKGGNGQKKYNGVPRLPPPPGSGPNNRPRPQQKKPPPPRRPPPQGQRPYSGKPPARNRPPPPPGKRPNYSPTRPKRPSYKPPGPRPSYSPPAQKPSYNPSAPKPSYRPPNPNPTYQPPAKNPSYKPSVQNPTYNPPAQNPAFNKKPAYQNPAQKQSYNPSAQKTGYKPKAQKQSYNPPAQNPKYNPAAQRPTFNKPAQKPTYNIPAQNPSFNPPAQNPTYNPPVQQPLFSSPAPKPSYGPKKPSYAPPTQSSDSARQPLSGGRGTYPPRGPPQASGERQNPRFNRPVQQPEYGQPSQYPVRFPQQTGSGAGRGPPTPGPVRFSGQKNTSPLTSNQWNTYPAEASSGSNAQPGVHPASHNEADPSINQIPGTNQWNQFNPGQIESNSPSGFKDNKEPGQISFVNNNNHFAGQTGQQETNSNVPDSMSSVSEQSKVVVVPPGGMIEDDKHNSISRQPTNTQTHPAEHGEGHKRNPGISSSTTFQGAPGGNTDPHSHNRVIGTSGSQNGVEKINVFNSGQSGNNQKKTNGFPRGPGRKPPKPSGPPPRRKPGPSQPAVPSRTTARPVRRKTQRPVSRSTARSVRNKTPRPIFNNANRPNQVSIDVPAFSPAEKAVNEPLYNGIVPREPYIPGPTPTFHNIDHNPNKERKTHGGVETQATVIQGDNQIIGSGPGIVVARPTDGYMQDVTIAGPDGRPVVIQTRQELVPQIDPSFTVSAGYPAYTDVYTIDPTAVPSFVSVASSSERVDYQGWLTDGDPLAGLPPLRPTATTRLDFTIQETEAPKTVTYQNEWNTPGKSPTADFRPHRPPPPNSNFANEFTALNFAGEVESIPVSIIRPSSSYSYSSIQRTEAPKTVTYENEWFANGENAPSADPGDRRHPASHDGQREQNTNRIRQPTKNANRVAPSSVGNGKTRHPGKLTDHVSTTRPQNRVTVQPLVRNPTSNGKRIRQQSQRLATSGTKAPTQKHPTNHGPQDHVTVRPLVRNPTSNGNRIRQQSQRLATSGTKAPTQKHPTNHGLRQNTRRPSIKSGQNVNSISQITTQATRRRRPTRRRPARPLRPIINDKERIDILSVDDNDTPGDILGANQWNTFSPSDPSPPEENTEYQLEDGSIVRIPVRPDILSVDDNDTPGDILGANQWNTFSPSDPSPQEENTEYQLEDGSIVRIPVRPNRPTFQRPPLRNPYNGRPTEPSYTESGLPEANPTRETYFDQPLAAGGNPLVGITGDAQDPFLRPNNQGPSNQPSLSDADPTRETLFDESSVVRDETAEGIIGDANDSYRKPSNQRPISPSYTETSLPNADPTGETFFDGSSFAGGPTPEIITGDVRDPPRPPTTQEAQTYDPFQEYQDTFPQDASPNIEVSSDGYNGFNRVGNNGFEENAQGNNEQYKDNGEAGGNVRVGGYPRVGTSSSGASGNVRRPDGQQGPTKRPYQSSEYVNEVRYPPRNRPKESDGDGGKVKGGGNFLKIPVEKLDKNKKVFSPTRETPLVSRTEGEESGRNSENNGEIDLASFFGGDQSHNKRPIRKFTTSSSTRTTFSTNGKPTFINIDHTSSHQPEREEDNTGKGSVIISTPSEGTETSSVSLIKPVKSTDYNQATTSGAVSLSNGDSSVNIFKFPQRPKPQPSLGLKSLNDDISDNEVINNNLGAAIVEQVPGNVLFGEDQDPQTRCQKSCAMNEMCQIKPNGDTGCRCRPGFGKRTNLPDAECEKSKMYQIEVLTTSESQETRIVRFNPQAVQRAVEDSLKNQIQDLYHSSEVTSIKVSNNTKRNFALENDAADRESSDNMRIKLLVEVRDETGEGRNDEDNIRSLESTLKNTQFPLGSVSSVSRVSVDDFDECTSAEYNDCSDRATCQNTKGSYTCSCMPGYLDLAAGANSGALPGRICSGASTECELCNRNGQCVLEASNVSCNCNQWFAGKNCQINLKLLLIVGAVSVCLMMIIACGVSCFCCKDRRKKNIPHPYGVSMARLPPHVRGQGLMMDPGGTVKSAMSGRSRQGRGKRSAPQHPHQHRPSSHMSSGSRGQGNTWQDSFGSVTSRGSQGAALSGSGGSVVARHQKPNLVIPRAKVTPSRSNNGFSNGGYHSDDDHLSSEQPERNRGTSEVASLASRHRRRSVPSFASGLLSGRGRSREGSVDPLLEGFQSDGGDSGGRQSNSTFHRSVSRGDFDAMDRADTRSVARSYNETIIRPITRRLQSAAGTSYRSNGSTRTGSQDGRNAEKDGGSSFVVSPQQQLYRLHDSDGSFESL